MRIRSVWVLLLAVVIVGIGVTAAHAVVPSPPYATSAQCLQCHELALGGPAISRTEFTNTTVDYTRCVKCHWATVGFSFGFPHDKMLYAPDCSSCHNSPNATNIWAGQVSTPYGYFATAVSPAAPASSVHSVHTTGSWPGTQFGSNFYCLSCHGAVGCDMCHVTQPSHSGHVASASPDPTYVGKTYSTSQGSLPSLNTRYETNFVATQVTCVASACHPIAALKAGAALPTCQSCHAAKTAAHGYEITVHSAADTSTAGVACSACHSLELGPEHAKTTSSSATSGCAACHPAPRDSLASWDRSCVTGGCHVGSSSAPMHANATAGHSVIAAGQVCLECHEGTDLAALHAGAKSATGASSCLVCHVSGAAPATNDCTVCHFKFADHYGAARHTSPWNLSTCTGSGCHSGSSDLLTAHTEKNAAFACRDCHSSNRPEVVAAIVAGNTQCGACHAAVSQTSGHRSTHWSNPLLQNAAGPNYSYFSGSRGTQSTGDCAGCHVSNLMDEHLGLVDPESGNAVRLPRKGVSGQALTCASCHASVDPRVSSAIALGKTACDDCHAVHGPIEQVHASTFGTNLAVDCAACHPASLLTQHNGRSATLPSGVQLSGCDVCHAYFDGARGAQIQGAISVSNDTKCTACHGADHPDKGGHSATSPTSLGCGSCHTKGDVAIDVRALHPRCATCHDNPSRVPDITKKSAECASCHAAVGTEYHRSMGASHTSSQTACSGTGGCHALNDLAALHSSATTTVAGETLTGCFVCHQSPTVQPVSPDCKSSGCHGTVDPHPAHLANASDDYTNGCFGTGCHYTPIQIWSSNLHSVGDLATFHSNAAAGKCAVCHANPTRGDITVGKTTYECAQSGCHADKSPLDPNHFPAASHDTTDGVDSSGFVCSDCHYLNVKSEHDAYFHLGWSCTGCHQYGYYAVAGTFGAWNKTCGATGCHSMWVNDVSTPAFHTRTGDEHNSQSTECAGTNCHNVNDVRTVHANATLTQGGVTYTGCKVCHTGPEKSARKWTARCTECHAGHGDLGAKHAASSSPTCAKCHPVGDVRSLHASATAGPCDVCHNNSNPNRVGDISTKTAECASCHSSEGTDYHSGLPGVHVYTAMSATCQSARCHVNTLPEAHATYIAGQSVYATACDLCHANTDPNRIPATATAACDSCHASIHPDMDHTAHNSQACVDCHETGDVMALHKKNGQTDCAVCHTNPSRVPTLPTTTDCVNCHPTVSATDGSHYAPASHTALDGTERGYACSACHSLEMKPEHSKASVSPVVTCVSCHETKVDGFTSPWNKTCAACHTARHSAMAAKHNSTKTVCAGTGCHAITDVSAIHAASTANCGVCHGAGKTPSTDCASAGCHPTITDNHEAQHDTAGVVDTGCYGCHFQFLTKEHATLGLTCATCHNSTNPSVKTAIATGKRECGACHPAVNGKSYHQPQDSNEFTAGNSSMHRVSAALPGMRSSFKVNATTYSWTLPTASSFLKTGWATDSIVTCDKCHTFTGASGPHGATAKVNFDPAYAGDYQTAYLGDSSLTPSNVICSKCHTNLSNANQVHAQGDHHGSSAGKCILCHSKVPHGWRLPRMLAYTNDPAAYASTGLTGISLTNHTPSNWTENDCATSCGEHAASMAGRWPSTLNTFGTLKGTVKSSAGVALAGVTVTTDKGQSATTNSLGAYDLGLLPTGAYQVSAAIAGFTSQTKSVTLVSNQATVADFALVAIQPGTLAGSVTAAANGAALSGVTVQVTGDGSATTGASGAYSLSLMPGTYTITYSLTGYVSQSKTVTITSSSTLTQNVALVAVVTSTNLSLNDPATASSTYGSTYAASKAVDGSLSSYWRSTSGGTQWLRVDLGTSQSFKKFEVDWYGTNYARSYRIETSTDGTNWTSRYSTSYGNGDSTITLTSPVTARYVRLYCTSANSSSYQVTEFQVWNQ